MANQKTTQPGIPKQRQAKVPQTPRIQVRKPTRQDDFTDEFHRLLGRLVHAHAQFDFNIGLQLNWLGAYYRKDVAEALNPLQSQLGKRLKVLKQLVLVAYEPAGKKALDSFRAWFERADEARALRNDFVHGRWGVPGGYSTTESGSAADAEPLLAFTRLHWDMTPNRPDDSVKITLGEFAEQVDKVEGLFAEYWELSERYRQFVKPSA